MGTGGGPVPIVASGDWSQPQHGNAQHIGAFAAS
jgi:hypothetical protein